MRELVEGPSVWRGRQIETASEWNERLDATEAAELLDAGAGASAEERPHISRLGRRLRERLEDGVGAVRLAGLPLEALEKHGEQGLERAFLALSGRIGTPVPQTTTGERIFRVQDAGLADSDARARGPNSRKPLTFHSDRCDVIGFLCVRAAAHGGENLLVSAGAIHNEIAATRPDLLETLYRSFYWQRHNIDTANVNPWYRMPVFARVGGRFAVTLMQVLIERAHAATELPDLTPGQSEALALVQTLAADPAFHLRFRQQPGEILLLNNYVTLHSRTGFEDRPGNARRLLLRVWLSVPNSRPLPHEWAAHYGRVEAGAMRGGIRVADAGRT